MIDKHTRRLFVVPVLMLCFVLQITPVQGQTSDQVKAIQTIKNWEKDRESEIYRAIAAKKVSELASSLNIRRYQGTKWLVIPNVPTSEHKGKRIYQIDLDQETVVLKRTWENCGRIYQLTSLDEMHSLVAWEKIDEHTMSLSVLDQQGNVLTTRSPGSVERVYDIFSRGKNIFLLYSPPTSKGPDCLNLRVFQFSKSGQNDVDIEQELLNETLTNNLVPEHPTIKIVKNKLIGVWLEYLKTPDGTIRWDKCQAKITVFEWNKQQNRIWYRGETNQKQYMFPHYGNPPVRFTLDLSDHPQKDQILSVRGDVLRTYGAGETGPTIKKGSSNIYRGTLDHVMSRLKTVKNKRNCKHTLERNRNNKNEEEAAGRNTLQEKRRTEELEERQKQIDKARERE